MATDPARDAAYAELFADRVRTQTVLDDMQAFIRTIHEPLVRAGAWELYGYMQLRASAQRRDKRRDVTKKGTRTT